MKKRALGFDAYLLSHPVTGVGRYSIGLMRGLLASHPNEISLRRYGRGSWQELSRAALESTLSPVEESGAPSSGGPIAALRRHAIKFIDTYPPAHRAWSIYSRSRYERASRRARIDLFYALNFMPPDLNRIPFVSVIHDLSHLRHPETHPSSRLRWLDRLPHAIETASAIQTVSEFTAGEIEQVFGVERERLHIVPPIVDEIFFERPDDLSIRLGRLGLREGGYILSVGTAEPRKNLSTIIEAFADLPPSVRQRRPLVLVGPKGWGNVPEPAAFDGLVAAGEIIQLGYISQETLRDLYAGAALMAYGSIYEGFGMPVAEASAQGTAVAISTAPALREAAGAGEGVYVTPALDIDGWRGVFLEHAEGVDGCKIVPDRIKAAERFREERVADGAWKVIQRATS